ncbi:MAG: hypothetical protein JXA97_12015 [Anaerolineales bacterium]|nr:hypothetical protein [Anaerolineales bacterium]
MLKDHVWYSSAGRTAAISAEVTRMQTAHDTVPVVAACRREAIMLYLWREKMQRWRALGIDRSDSLNPDFAGIRFDSPEVSMIDKLSRRGWCHRIGLVSGLNLVFVVFKAVSGGSDMLFVDVFRLSSNEDELERVTPEPAAIPYSRNIFHRTGYYLWAGFSPADSADPDAKDRLVILTQTFGDREGPASLSHFSIEARDDPGHYINHNAWTFNTVGDLAGGYDLDARLDGGEIHCIFRQQPYPVSFDFAGGYAESDGSLKVRHGEIAPLHWMRLRAQDGTLLEHETDLPGGEHPQIQSVEPRAYTADRFSEGSVVMDTSADLIKLRYEVTQSRKHLFLHADGAWTSTALMEFPEDRHVRSPIKHIATWGIQDPILFVPDRTQKVMQVARVHPLLPVYAARLDWSDDVLELDLVHHNHKLGALVMTHIRHEPQGHNFGRPDLNSYAILNINHGYIEDPSTSSPSTASENGAFKPFKFQSIQDKDTAFSWKLRDSGWMTNNTGGDLAMERCAASARAIAFVHPGDGGVRLLPDFDPAKIKTAGNPSPQLHTPAAVTGDGDGSERVIVQSGEWMDLDLGADAHFYVQNSTVFCGLDYQLHKLFTAAHAGLIGTLSDDETTVILEMDMLPGNPGAVEAWTVLWDIWNQINVQAASSSDLINSIGNMTLEVSRFIINWEIPPQKVTVTVSPDFRIQYRFLQRTSGQGFIESRFLIRVWLPAVSLTPWLRPLAATEVEVNLDYRRRYSPALLMNDTVQIESQTVDRMGDSNAAVLTAKPVRDCELMPVEVKPDFQWTVGGHALVIFLPMLIGLLFGLGLGWLATSLSGLIARMTAEFASLVGIVAGIGTYFSIVSILEIVVPDEIEKVVKAKVEAYDFKALLDDNQVHTNAGEGIAEDIAWRALSETEREVQGVNRYKQGIWRMVYVTEKQCRVFRAEA